MSIVGWFEPANAKARKITAGDMKLALAELERKLPWIVGEDGVLERKDGSQEMSVDDDLGIQGFDEDVIELLGQFFADRAGAQRFEDDAGRKPIEFAPAKGSRRQAAPVENKPKRAATKPRVYRARFVPLQPLLDDLDDVARVLWLNTGDLPASRAVTLDDVMAAAKQRRLRATTSKTAVTIAKPPMRFTLDKKLLTIEAAIGDDTVHALMSALAGIAGPFGLVVGDAAIAAFAERASAFGEGFA